MNLVRLSPEHGTLLDLAYLATLMTTKFSWEYKCVDVVDLIYYVLFIIFLKARNLFYVLSVRAVLIFLRLPSI